MQVIKELNTKTWHAEYSAQEQNDAMTALENGMILLFPSLPFTLSPTEHSLLSPRFADPKAKNISFHLQTGKLRCGECSDDERANLKKMVHRFAEQAKGLVQQLFPTYLSALEIGRTSYRPVEVAGRISSYRKDDTRLHVDAFPATPNQGKRILRVFSNINPHGQSRHWRVGEPFAQVAERFLARIRRPLWGESAVLKALRITKSKRTEYDHIMLQIHDRMKADLEYQKNVMQQDVHFHPGSTWIVQTDHVSHAAMSGQFLMEQTFYLPVSAMQNPACSPLRVLEGMAGRALVPACD